MPGTQPLENTSTEVSQSGPAESGSDALDSMLEAAWSEQESGDSSAVESADSSRSRDERGRFAKNAELDAAAAENIDQPAAEGDEPEEDVQADPANAGDAPIVAPQSWSPEEKAEFATLPRNIQDIVLKREMQRDRGFNRVLEKERAQVSDVLRAIEPFREQIQLAGKTPGQLIGQWAAAESFLSRDPEQAIAFLMRHHGVDPRVYIGAQSQEDPRLQQIDQRFQSLEERLEARARAEQHQHLSSLERTVEVFAAETEANGQPKRPHLEEVLDDILMDIPGLLTRHPEASPQQLLQHAYERAVYANPTTRQKLLEAQTKMQEAGRFVESKAKAQQAQRERMPSTGKPGGINFKAKPKNLDDILEAAWNEQL